MPAKVCPCWALFIDYQPEQRQTEGNSAHNSNTQYVITDWSDESYPCDGVIMTGQGK